MNHARLQLLYKRQGKPTWGRDYVPGILATVGEAPSISWAVRVWSSLVGRELHCLSLGELAALCLALYHPTLRDLQEQRVLWPMATSHPLAGSPFDADDNLPPLPGTVAVAKELRCLSHIPRVRVPDPDRPGMYLQAAFPFFGDLLLYLKDATGVYCVNWNIRPRREDFERPFLGDLRHKTSERAAEREVSRHLIERAYYAGAGIRTVQVASTDIDPTVAANLRMLLDAQARLIDLSSHGVRDLEMRLIRGLQTQTPPRESFDAVIWTHRLRPDLCIRVLYHMIWTRQLNVDLYSQILEDHPLRPANRDVLSHYADWFAR